MEGSSKGCLYNRRKSAINGWDVSRKAGLPARDQWIIEEISLAKDVWMRVRGMGYFPWRVFSSGGFQQPVGQPASALAAGILGWTGHSDSYWIRTKGPAIRVGWLIWNW